MTYLLRTDAEDVFLLGVTQVTSLSPHLLNEVPGMITMPGMECRAVGWPDGYAVGASPAFISSCYLHRGRCYPLHKGSWIIQNGWLLEVKGENRSMEGRLVRQAIEDAVRGKRGLPRGVALLLGDARFESASHGGHTFTYALPGEASRCITDLPHLPVDSASFLPQWRTPDETAQVVVGHHPGGVPTLVRPLSRACALPHPVNAWLARREGRNHYTPLVAMDGHGPVPWEGLRGGAYRLAPITASIDPVLDVLYKPSYSFSVKEFMNDHEIYVLPVDGEAY